MPARIAVPPSTAVDHDAQGATEARPPPPTWTYTVSVRSLCEFTARRGDLDRRFTPSATALEGIAGQAAVVARRGSGYDSEVALQGHHDTLRVRGRADGYDTVRRCLEEIKTIRGHPDELPENRRHLHWAQLQTYGALFCRERGVDELQLALVYVDAATQSEVALQQLCSAEELEAAFSERCEAFLAWSQQEAAHRSARDDALGRLPFPPGEFRPGQRGLAEAVYRAAVSGRCLLAQAPTGIGKTIGTLYPMLRAMPGQQIDKLAYLTCKGTGRFTALEALHALREGMVGRARAEQISGCSRGEPAPEPVPGRPLRVLTLVAKEQACEHPDKACHGDSCPLARGFHDRLPTARIEAVAAGWLDPAAQRRIALRHGICPYYLGQELLRWTDVVVGDVHHAFDPNGQLHGLAQAQEWRVAMLVDEAHNLVERTRRMYSGTLTLAQTRAARALAPTALQSRFGRLQRALLDAAELQAADYQAYDALPQAIGEALSALVAALGEHLQTQPLATGPLLNFHFDALRMLELSDDCSAHSILDIERRDAVDSHQADGAHRDLTCGLTCGLADDTAHDTPHDTHHDITLSLRNVVPAGYLRPRFEACRTAVLFSATLAPEAYQRDLLGLPESTAWIDVPPAFAPENLRVRIAGHVSTRFPDRAASLDDVVALLATQFDSEPGNYLAFFSSFDYADRVADRLAALHPRLPQWRQGRAMDEASRLAFLARFEPAGRGIAFAVLGGAFAEGVDLPGTRLIGAFVATLGLPPVTPVQEQLRARLDARFGAGHGYADLVPGLQRVVQAAGRVLRTPDDRGCLWLIDDRYRRANVRRLLPKWWRVARAGTDLATDPAGAPERTPTPL